MAKKESTLINMIIAMLVIAIVAGFAITEVYLVTKAPIAKVEKKKQEDALKTVLPDFDNITIVDTLADGKPVEIFKAYKNNELIGYAVNTYSMNGFSGEIRLMAGFLTDGTINNITVLNHKETPGLGSKMAEEKFLSQFRNKNPKTFKLNVKKDQGDVDAITAATISSRAFCDAVTRGAKLITEE